MPGAASKARLVLADLRSQAHDGLVRGWDDPEVARDLFHTRIGAAAGAVTEA